MTISIPKTNVVTPILDYVCIIASSSADSLDVVSNIAPYKYLGVQQYSCTWCTIPCKGEDALKWAQMYKNVILSS